MTKKIILTLIFIMLLTGCWDERVLEDLALITVITMDKDEDKIILAASYPEFSKGSKSPESLLANKARTTAEGLHKLSRLTDKMIVGGQIQVVLVGEDLAKEGISDILDTLQRNVEISGTILICVTEGKANEILKTAFNDKPLDGFYISRLIKKQEEISELPATSLHEFQNDLHSERTDPILPYIKLKQKELEASETAIFVDDRFVDYITTEETQLLVMLRNDGTSSQFTIETNPEKNEYTTISFVDSRTTVDVEEMNGQIVYDVTLTMTSELIEHEGDEDIHSVETFEKLSKQFENYIEAVANDVVTRLQTDYRADPIGLGEYARPYFGQNSTVSDWRESFHQSEINIHVELTITRDGDYR